MRILLAIYILIFLSSCSSSPEEKHQTIQSNWEKVDLGSSNEKKLDSEFGKPVEYIRANRPHLGYQVDTSLETSADTLKAQNAL